MGNLESQNSELSAQNSTLTEECCETTKELQYMKGRLNEWTYYEKEQKSDAKAPQQNSVTPDRLDKTSPGAKREGMQFGADRHEDLMAEHNSRHNPPIQNKKMNFSANLGSKGNWF